jgi:NADH-ubiquinone oxidoreductase B18 subunit (NDUFB7)
MAGGHHQDGHDEHGGIPSDWQWPMIPSQGEMDANRIHLEMRDRCVGLYIPLMQCRRDNFLMDYLCQDYLFPYLKCRHYE